MNKEEPSGEEDPEEVAVDRFMEGGIRANRLIDLCDALRARIRGMKEEMARTAPSPERDDLEQRILDARHQIAVLQQELAVSQFVEESVRATFRQDKPDLEYDDYGEEDF